MKLKLLILAPLIALILGCADNKKNEEIAKLKAEVENLQKENKSLKAGDKKLKASIGEYKKFLKEIEQNLAEIDKSKALMGSLNTEVKKGKDVTAQIKEHLANIRANMENSRLKIVAMDQMMNKLRKESEGKNEEILELERQMKGLTKSLLDKDMEIEQLDDQIAELEDLYQLEQKYTAELKAILNRAYVVIASDKKLKKLGVITNEGGFVGIGRVKIINANSADSVFTKIEKDQFNEIAINAKAELISKHAEGTYQLVSSKGKVEKLVILDQAGFWKNGNYLVIKKD